MGSCWAFCGPQESGGSGWICSARADGSQYEVFADSLQSRADCALREWVGGLHGADLREVLRAAGTAEAEITQWSDRTSERKARLLRGQGLAGDCHCDVGLDADVALTAWAVAADLSEGMDDWADTLADELGLTQEQARAAAQWDEQTTNYLSIGGLF